MINIVVKATTSHQIIVELARTERINQYTSWQTCSLDEHIETLTRGRTDPYSVPTEQHPRLHQARHQEGI